MVFIINAVIFWLLVRKEMEIKIAIFLGMAILFDKNYLGWSFNILMLIK